MLHLIAETGEFVNNFLEENLPETSKYHNPTHTNRVLKSTKELIESSDLSEEDSLVLQLAALLHDIGYTEGYKDHEARSARIASEFLKEKKVETHIIDKVVGCIMATRMEAEPKNELHRIIRDADASHFGKKYFEEASEFLRQEFKLQGIKDYSKEEWLEENIDLLKNKHHFYTSYAQEHWEPQKHKNIAKMLETQKKIQDKKAEKLAIKAADPEKAVQSVFRVTLRNHIKLSDIADTKANILLSVNAIIISIALSNLIPKLDNPSNAYLIVPTIIFLIFAVVSIVLSVLATRPNVTSGKFTKEDVDNKKVNLLFFGNFHKMKQEEFEWAMNEMLHDKNYMYSSMTKDLYFLGLVLQRKYKILRLTYNIFMTGIVVSVIAFAVAFKLGVN